MSNSKFVRQKVTLVLSNLHTAWLDEVAVGIRRNTGAAISRSSLIRATIEAMYFGRLDLSTCTSERAISERILAYLSTDRR